MHNSVETLDTVAQYLARTTDHKMKRGASLATAMDDILKMNSLEGFLASQGVAHRRAKDTEVETPAQKSSRPKEGFCNDYQQGRCTRGQDCRYQHVCRGCLKAGHGLHACWSKAGGRGHGGDPPGRYPSRSPERAFDPRDDRRAERGDDRRGGRYDRPRDERRDDRRDGRRR